ncbi:hypothetical protein BDB01DRAFT_799429 [Pilobolus umbonatus]|nr:hypothetical protein BDB01DRAFT_799429 [Pilobolus umbonatus]
MDTKTANVILALGPDQAFNTKKVYHSPDNSSNESLISVSEKTRWACHKDILKSTSHYFDSIFNSQFQEADASIVFLPRGIFNSMILDSIVTFMYTQSVAVDDMKLLSNDRSMELLDQLQSLYLASDYLGIDKLCILVDEKITELTHGLTCYCDRCTFIVPRLLSFTGSYQQDDARLVKMTHKILKLLIQDPEKTLPTYWSSQSLATLLTQNIEMEHLHSYLEERLHEHVNKNNAIETLHGCFIAERVLSKRAEEGRDWPDTFLHTIKRMQNTSSRLLVDNFDFYCTKYPELLSCVDGITYSVDYLDYLFTVILDNQMTEMNAPSLYKGVVRNLMCRDSVQNNIVIKSILKSARETIVRFIGSHLPAIKELDIIDRHIIEPLAQDLNVPVSLLAYEDPNKTPKSSHKKSKSTSVHSKKKADTSPSWNTKIKTRIQSMLFGHNLQYKVGQRVQLVNRPVMTIGKIAYVGKVTMEGKDTMMLGIELDRSVGMNNGSIEGKQYFTTTSNKGVFVRPNEVIILN